jgi:hypothetical protein
MPSGPGGFPPPLTGGGDPAASGNVAQGLEAMSPTLVMTATFSLCPRVAEAIPVRPEEKFATDCFFLDGMGREFSEDGRARPPTGPTRVGSHLVPPADSGHR